ncbi:MAG: MarR family winged helix-turn-helix transcriptional regulator [Rhizomicrobium sp.]
MDDPKRLLVMKLTAIGRLLWLSFNQSAERIGVTQAKWTLIAAVARNPGATQRSIASALHVTDVTAGRLIDRLCEDGYIERRENPDDRRSYRVYLTPAARPVLDRLREIAAAHTDEAFAGLDDKDMEKLGALLDVISRNVGAVRGQ